MKCGSALWSRALDRQGVEQATDWHEFSLAATHNVRCPLSQNQ